MFQMKEQDVKFVNLNTRTEKHGPETRPAVDLQVRWLTQNDSLDLFDKDLKPHFFKKAPKEDEEQGDLADQGVEYSLRRFDECKCIKWEYKSAGHRMLIHRGIDENNIVIGDCKVDKFQFEFKKGGLVEISFKISACPSKLAAGEIFDLQGDDITITMEPPESQPTNSMFEDDDEAA